MGGTHWAQYTGIGDDDTEESVAVAPLMKKRKRLTSQFNFHTTKGLFHERMSFVQIFRLVKFCGRTDVRTGVRQSANAMCASLALNTVRYVKTFKQRRETTQSSQATHS